MKSQTCYLHRRTSVKESPVFFNPYSYNTKEGTLVDRQQSRITNLVIGRPKVCITTQRKMWYLSMSRVDVRFESTFKQVYCVLRKYVSSCHWLLMLTVDPEFRPPGVRLKGSLVLYLSLRILNMKLKESPSFLGYTPL